MQFKQLEYFVTLSKSKSMNEAAEKLYVTQPTLSASVAALEKELGVTLFTRTNKGVSLTSQGLEILEEAQTIIDIVYQWYKRYNTSFSTPIHIYATPIICSTILVDAIMKVRELYPEIMFELHEKIVPTPQNSPKKEFSLAIGVYESADVPSISYFVEKNGWRTENIFCGQTYAFINAKSPLAEQKTVSLQDLSNACIVTYPYLEKNFPYGQFIQFFKKRKVQTFSNRESQYKAISENLDTIGIFSELALLDNYHIASKSIKAVPIDNYPLPINVLIFYPNTTALTSYEKNTIITIKDIFSRLN